MEYENHKMIEMPEKRRYLSAAYQSSQAIPSQSSDSPQEDDPNPIPEVPPEPSLEAARELSLHTEYELDAGEDFHKYPSPAAQSVPVWKRRRCGHSMRFWCLIAVCVLLLLMIVGAVLGVKLGHKNDSWNPSSSDQTTTITPVPANVTQTLNCPSVNTKIYNITGGADPETGTISSVPFQFKKFCNKAAITASNNISQITTSEAESSGTFIQNPTIASSLNNCIQQCVAYNVAEQLGSGKAVPCFGAWFNANQTGSSGYSSTSYEYSYNNCILYTVTEGNFTLADLLVQSGGSTAMAIMVSWDNSSFVGTYLSDNGDWSGGVTSVKVII